jgi:glycosyltransferase involved in cell wall biosynthesis
VAYVATLLLTALADLDVEVDCHLGCRLQEVPERLLGHPNITVRCLPTPFEYGRWYSRTDVTKLLSGTAFNAGQQVRLARAVAASHARRHYDVLYQFSHLETAALRPFRRRLPPLVLHPEVHAAGELRWMRRERRAGLSAASPGREATIEALLALRAGAQRRGIPLARTVLAPSRRFAELLASDYHVPLERLRVVPNPVDTDRFAPPTDPRPATPLRLLFVSRLAVRKGVELIVGLTHRLRDLRGHVRVEIVGDRSLFSDYRHLLRGMSDDIGEYRGPLPGGQIRERYQAAHALLQPSHYEPFALTVAEGLASGLPVVATPEVGATEGVSPAVCRLAKAGDLDDLERVVRGLIVDLRDERLRRELSHAARDEARRLYSASVVGPRLVAALFALA